MNINNLSLPYPVLGISDDVLPLPEIPTVDPVPNDPHEHIITLHLNTNNPFIDSLVKDGLAVYTCEVECRKTFYRVCVTSSEKDFDVRFPRKAVAGEIRLFPTVTATKQIPNYENPGFHEDFKGFTFQIEPGDLLCLFNRLDYFADINFDKLKSVSTFITILPTDKELSYIDLDKPKIHLYLPKELHTLYRTKINNQGEFNASLHSSLAMNALVYALSQIDKFPDTKWSQTIKYRMQTESEFENLDLENASDILAIAQNLLGNPYKRMFNDFANSLD